MCVHAILWNSSQELSMPNLVVGNKNTQLYPLRFP